MKKRIVCVLLTLIMLLSLVPMGASAASHKISEAAITVLKQMTTLKTQCYHYSGSEFRTGYGTVCEEDHSFGTNGQPKLGADGKPVSKHTITEENADIALREALVDLDKQVCAFETANKLSLKQNQHDALVVFSYNAGTGWMNGSGVLKSVIINKGTTNELLNAMNLWTKNADLTRRKVEVNMYVNGIYSNTAPSSYGSVVYDPNGGDMPQDDFYFSAGKYTYYYDVNASMNHPVVPTRKGYIFLGWYGNCDVNQPNWAPTLTKLVNGFNLTALWQGGYDDSNPEAVAAEVDYQLHKSHLASKKVYANITDEKYNKDMTEDLDDYLDDHDDLVWVDYDYIAKDGTRWSRLDIGGWVKVGAAADNDSFKDSNGTVIATATVTVNGYLNLRQEAGTDSAIIGALAKNDTVNIYEIKTVNGHQWGLCKSGWLCLTYTRVIMKDDVSVSDEGRLAYTFTGRVNSGNVLVHVEPGDNNNYVQYTVPDALNPEGEDRKVDLYIPEKTDVIVTNLAVYKNSETWAKVSWQNPEWDWKSKKASDGKKEFKVTRSGWVKLVPAPVGPGVELNPVTYTVVADSVNVRDGWGDGEDLLMALNKGVQVQVNLVALIGENMWGRIQLKDINNNHVDSDDSTVQNTIYGTGYGYVNLASKYFSRADAPTVEDETFGDLIATVIGTDSLRVRKTGATYGQQIGRLARGVTVIVWEYDDGWYKLDSNQNGTYDYKEDGWCSENYLDVRKGKIDGSSTITDSAGNKYQTDGTGKGIVANTYSGVNVRTGPSTGYAASGKLLPGTIVEILETKNAGKWGRVVQGWICMDYVTMVSYNEVIDDTTTNGTTVESFEKAETTTTTAVYTGRMSGTATVYRNPTKDQEAAEVIRTAAAGENVTVYELAKVTEVVQSDDEESADGSVITNTTVSTTTYWARINDGWIENPDLCLALNALDEKVHTLTGAKTLNIRYEANGGVIADTSLVQGDQVNVTALKIAKNPDTKTMSVWGRIEDSRIKVNDGAGWICLDYMSEGAVYVKAPVQNNTTNNNQVVFGNSSSVGGFVNNTSGYRYTGKVIRANSVKVRSTPSLGASVTTNLTNGQALVVYETTVAENMAWGRCDAGWIYLYYVDLTPAVNGAVDARVVYNDNTIIYSDVNGSSVAGTYSRMSTIDIYEIVGKMARTELGWVNTDNLL